MEPHITVVSQNAAQVSASRLAAADDDELTQPSQAGAGAGGGSATAAEAAARARGKLVSALMKRHLVEQVVPVLVELRRLLAEVKDVNIDLSLAETSAMRVC
jgi:hypothetical protein